MRHCVSLALLLSIVSSCSFFPAAFSPWQEAPASPKVAWNTRPIEKKAEKKGDEIAQRILPITLPEQEEPLSLAELIDVALQNNYATQETWAEARKSAALYGQSQQNFFPILNGSYVYDRARAIALSGTSSAGAINSIVYQSLWGPQLALSFLVFDFGQTRATSQAALQALYNANLTHNREIETVIATVSTNYYNYLYQKKLYSSYEQDVADAKMVLESAMVKLKAGITDTSDVLQAKSQLLQSQTVMVTQKQQIQIAASDLLTNMGLPAHISLNVQQMPEDPRVFEIMSSVQELIHLALKKRSDLFAAEADLRSQQFILSAARRKMLPVVNSEFNYGRTSYSGSDIKGHVTDHHDFEGTLSLSWSLFNGLFDLNAIRKAESNRDYARALLKQTELQVVEDVTNAHSDVGVSREALNYAQDFLKAAQEEYRVTLAQYRSGTKDILTVVSAQTSLAKARAMQANALQSWYSSLATLAYATGIIDHDPSSFLGENS